MHFLAGLGTGLILTFIVTFLYGRRIKTKLSADVGLVVNELKEWDSKANEGSAAAIAQLEARLRQILPLLLIATAALLMTSAKAAAQACRAPYRCQGAVFLNNPALTPGAIRTTSAAEICAPGFRTAPFRNTTAKMKDQAYAEYGVKRNQGPCKGGCEVDHLVPLELGGKDDVTNLWPQPSRPAPGFHEKDKAENYLHREVCSGRMKLADAQEQLRSNWLAVYETIRGGS